MGDSQRTRQNVPPPRTLEMDDGRPDFRSAKFAATATATVTASVVRGARLTASGTGKGSRRLWLSAVGAAAVVLTIAGCSASGSGAQSVAFQGGPQGKTVALLGCPASGTKYCGILNETIVKGLESQGVKVQRLDDEGFDPALQVQQMDQAVSQKADLIITDMSDPNAMVPAIARAKRAGVAVMTLDGRAAHESIEHVVTQVVTPADDSGRIAAEALIKYMQQAGYSGGNVVVLSGSKSFLIAQDRLEAFNKVMAANPSYKVVADPDAAWDPAKSGTLTRQLVSQHRSQGDIQGIYAMTDEMAAAAVNALKEAGVRVGVDPGATVVVGGTCAHEGVEGIKKGTIEASVTQIPTDVGKKAVETAIAMFNGHNVDKTINVPVYELNSTNLEHFQGCDTY
jgi:ribose transport system substrate-binding protein